MIEITSRAPGRACRVAAGTGSRPRAEMAMAEIKQFLIRNPILKSLFGIDFAHRTPTRQRHTGPKVLVLGWCGRGKCVARHRDSRSSIEEDVPYLNRPHVVTLGALLNTDSVPRLYNQGSRITPGTGSGGHNTQWHHDRCHNLPQLRPAAAHVPSHFPHSLSLSSSLSSSSSSKSRKPPSRSSRSTSPVPSPAGHTRPTS